jgi:hypothetical protein
VCLSGGSDKKINPVLVQACNDNARRWKHPEWTGTQPLSYPESPLKYIIDFNHINDPETIKRLNGNNSWKGALEDTTRRCFISPPPVDVHLESQVHSVKLTFTLPGGDYQNLPKVCERILVASRNKKGFTNLSLNADQKQQLFKMLGETVDSSTTKMDTSCSGGYHMLIRDIYVTDYNNNLPITLGGMLITHDPLTNKEKSWCNTRHISNVRSSAFKGASAVVIPACSSVKDVKDQMWTVPLEHYHPDVSRFLNVNYDSLKSELKEMKLSGKARKVPIGVEPTKAQLKENPDADKRITYSLYEIKMPELTATRAENMIQFIVMERYADILLRTSAIPDITTTQETLYTAYDTGMKGYRFLSVVFDSIVDEYEPYMRHRNYLMSLDGEVTFALMPERPLNEVEQDITNFNADSKAQYYGQPLSVTIQIDFETFQNNEAILPKSSSSSSGGTLVKKKKKNKEKEKEKKPKVKSHKKDLLKRSKSGSIKPPKNRNDYLVHDTSSSEQQQTTSTLVDPGTTTMTTAAEPQSIMRPRGGGGRLGLAARASASQSKQSSVLLG